ncbi:MAG: hypothetical protein ACLP66_01425 [Polyangia bacterium]
MLTVDAYPNNQAFPLARVSADVTRPAASAAPMVDADEPSPLSVNVENTTENTVIGQAPYGDRTKPPQDVTW